MTRLDMTRLDMTRGDGMMMMMRGSQRAISIIEHPPLQSHPHCTKPTTPPSTLRKHSKRLTAREPCGRWLNPLSRQHRQLSARLAHSEELPFPSSPAEETSWNAASPRLTAPTEAFVNLPGSTRRARRQRKAAQYVTKLARCDKPTE